MRQVPLASFFSPLLLTQARRRIAQWDACVMKPQTVQWSTLLDHCQNAAFTEFGKAHGLSRIRNYQDFKNQVPLRTYADFEPYIQRMRAGAVHVLWPGLIPFYGQSSGSSNTQAQHKFLPISHQQIRWQKKAGFDLLARYLTLTDDHEFLGGFNLGLFPPSTLTLESRGVYQGSNPGIMMRFLPPLAKWMSIPQNPIRDITHYEKKIAAIAEHYFHYDVRSIGGTTCWFSVLFDHVLKVAQSRGADSSVTINAIWPNLKVLFGGGVHAEPYRKVIQDKVGKPIPLIDNYNATEGGIFAVTDSLEEPGMRILPDRGVFFEFIPRSEHGKPHPTRVPLWEVEPNVDYSIAVSTCSGLLGYYLGDLIRFVSIFPHRLEFRGRVSGVLSLTQELTSYIEIENSISYANQKLGCTTIDYSASAEVGVHGSGKGRYVFFVEFHHQPDDLTTYLEAIDEELCRQNRVYREHRIGDVAILFPRLVCLPVGATQKLMKFMGRDHVQSKFPRIIDPSKIDIFNSLL